MALLEHPSAPARIAIARPSPFWWQQLALLAVAVAVYFGVRHVTEGNVSTAVRNAGWIVELERALGVFVERDLQGWALSFDGVLQVVNTIYIWGHWPVIAAVFAWLVLRRRDAFGIYRDALLLSGLAGMLIVAAFPVAPPRLMDLGFLDSVTAHSSSYRVMQPPSFTNQYAAMPSFHVGWDLLVGLALVREGGRRWMRWVGGALPVLMFASVVITGNHYFLDGVVGDAIVLASLALVTTWHGRRGLPVTGAGRARPAPRAPRSTASGSPRSRTAR